MWIPQIGLGGSVPVGEAAAPKQPNGQSFIHLVESMLADANREQIQADQAVNQFATGQTDNIHHVMIALGRADLSLRTVLEIRNRLTETYQDIMRMQV